MGKADKLHRKKVKARNEKLKGRVKKAQERVWEKYYEWKKEQDGNKDTDDKGIQAINFNG